VLQIHVEGFNRALGQQDYKSLEAIYSDRYILVRPDGSVLNKQQVLRDLREGSLTFHIIELEGVEVRALGSSALLTARSKTLSSRNGKRAQAYIRLVAVYAQKADAIRLVHFQSNTLPEEPVAVSEVNRGAVIGKVETERFTIVFTKRFEVEPHFSAKDLLPVGNIKYRQ
jgi:ketosteroid isomerase-like protein